MWVFAEAVSSYETASANTLVPQHSPPISGASTTVEVHAMIVQETPPSHKTCG